MSRKHAYVALPKIELHAHLTGSISRRCLHEIWCQQLSDAETAGRPSTGLCLSDPLLEMPEDKNDYDLHTFFPLFSTYIYSLVATPAALIYSTNAVLNDFANDGCVYLELRTTPRGMVATATTPALSKQNYIQTILDCMKSSPTRARMHTALILSIDRRNTAAEADQVVDLALRTRDSGQPVVGIDLCGDPAVTKNLRSFTPAFRRARDAGLKITLHFAEAPVSSTDEELELLLSWEPDRVGHVIHVPSHIKAVIRQRRLCLELCLSCNVRAKMLVGMEDGREMGISEHHFGEWWDMGRGACPIAICTDDVGVFGSMLSDEHRLVSEHFGLSPQEMVMLVRSSIDSIFSGEEEKERLRRLIC